MAKWVSAQTLRHWITTGRPLTMIDVRLGQVETIDAAVHIPVTDLEDEPRSFPRDHDLVVFCQHGGGGSEYAAEVLEEQGYGRVYILTGGVDAYLAAATAQRAGVQEP